MLPEIAGFTPDQLVCGDSLALLQKTKSNSVDLVLTSPPYYQQRIYSNESLEMGTEKNPEAYLDSLLQVFGECVRVIKDTGSLVFNLGDKYQNGGLLLLPYQFALEATKRYSVTLINQITWGKSNPTPRQYKRRLVSSTEPFFHFVKTPDYKYFLDEFLKKEDALPLPKLQPNASKIGQSYFTLIDNSLLSLSQKEKAKKDLLTVIEEVKNGKIQGFRMKIKGIHAEPFGGQEGGRKNQLEKQGFTIIKINGNPLKKDLILTSVETIKGCPHPAIYPEAITTELIRLLTDPDDLVLDPFCGSGTTAVSARKLGRHYLGFDLSPEYCAYAEKRLAEINLTKS